MRLRRLEIERFRGVRALDWKGIGDTACLVGPGDSSKSTILDAIECVLSPRWNIPFDDSDFFELNTESPIAIRATVVELPQILLRDDKLGLILQVFDDEIGEAVPLSEDKDVGNACVIQLSVGGNHEPQWSVIDSRGEHHQLRTSDREYLGMLRVGSFVDYHLGWKKGSALTRITDKGDDVGAVITEATRLAREGLDLDSLSRLQDAAADAEKHGKELGAVIQKKLTPHLDVSSLSFTGGALSLHDGKVPLRRAGLGTRRLMTIAMQYNATAGHGITLVDEFEQGLEPHRIRQLLRKLRGLLPEEKDTRVGQLVLTTHSPVVISEMSQSELVVTRRHSDGHVVIRDISESVFKAARKRPAALLARRVVVAEGDTELGVLDALESLWGKDGSSFAYWGTIIVDGVGDNGPSIAGAFDALGYRTALFCDSDVTRAKLSRAGNAKIISWDCNRSTEEAIANDLSDAGFEQTVALARESIAADRKSEQSLRDSIAAAAGMQPDTIGDALQDWVTSVPDLRNVFGKAAKKKGWFKTREFGARLGLIIAAEWDSLEGKSLYTVLERIRGFAQQR